MGADGLTNATRYAILNAKYQKAVLKEYYPILYSGKNGRVAHEMILDCRGFKAAGIEVGDIAKRLMDYGFHAPTVSFPVAGTLKVETTESESMEALDRFCEDMRDIREDVDTVDDKGDKVVNLLKLATSTVEVIGTYDWGRPYSEWQ